MSQDPVQHNKAAVECEAINKILCSRHQEVIMCTPDGRIFERSSRWCESLKYELDSEIMRGEEEAARSPLEYWYFISTFKQKLNDDIITPTEDTLVHLCFITEHQILASPSSLLSFISKALWYATSALLEGFQSEFTCNTRIVNAGRSSLSHFYPSLLPYQLRTAL